MYNRQVGKKLIQGGEFLPSIAVVRLGSIYELLEDWSRHGNLLDRHRVGSLHLPAGT